MAPASSRRNRPANRYRAGPVRPGEFSTNGHGLGVPVKRHPSKDMEGVLVLLAVKLDLQASFRTRLDGMSRGDLAAGQAVFHESNRNLANKSCFQMTHMCFSTGLLQVRNQIDRLVGG